VYSRLGGGVGRGILGRQGMIQIAAEAHPDGESGHGRKQGSRFCGGALPEEAIKGPRATVVREHENGVNAGRTT